MERAFHSTSHLGRMNIDHLLGRAIHTDRVKLRIYCTAAKNKMMQAVLFNNGDMWARAWATYKEYTEQLAILDAIESGAIKAL